MTFVAELEPKALWGRFDQILTIPRGSKEEDKIREFVIGIAEKAGLEYAVDPTGNVVVKKPGSPGKEGAPVTILQSHLDMVNEKNSDVEFDFDTDAIEPVRDGEWLTANGTTLGSDNGIGVASMLAILESPELVHGPLEFLFTIDEETGLTGAGGLDASMLDGRRLINLDSEEEGALTVGCAGGADTELRLPLESAEVSKSSSVFRVKLHGMNGGHSGIDIHLQRGNAVQLLARILQASSPRMGLRLAHMKGGNKHNAIPREAFATAVVPDAASAGFLSELKSRYQEVRDEFASVEPEMKMAIEDIDPPAEAWDQQTTDKALDFLVSLPHGVVAMSNDIPGLVETSTNLAVAEPDGAELSVLLSSRSSVASALGWIRQKIRAIAALAGATVNEHDGYPGWKPDLDSQLLKVVKGVHTRVVGKEPHVEAVHAGLECGIIGEMVPGMDMISFGPQIEFPHSPNERVLIDSVGRFYDLLTEVLRELAG